MRMLLDISRKHRAQTVLMLVLLLLAGVAEGISLSALLPLLSIALENQGGGEQGASGGMLGQIVTEALQSIGLTPGIGVLLIVVVVGITLKSGLVLLAKKRVGYTVAQVSTDMRLDLLRSLLETRWSYYLHQSVGGLANAIGSEPMRASMAYLNGVLALALFIQCTVYAAVAFSIAWQATLACLAAGAVLFYLLNRLVDMARRAGRRHTQLIMSLVTQLVDSLQSVKLLKAMAREDLVDTVLAAETRRLNRALRKEVFSQEALRAAQQPLYAILIAAGLYVTLVLWGLPVATVLVLTVLLARLLDHLGKVQKQYQKFATGESAYWSFQSTIHRARDAREESSGTRTPVLEQGVRLDGVCFGYTDTPVLRDCSLSVPFGSITAIVGESGAGKTTIIDLVMGLHAPQAGQVLIDDEPLTTVDLRRWRRLIGYVPQEHLILHDTVMLNVTFGDEALDEADAERALRMAGAWDFVSRLPEGLQTTVGERGTRFSGGQRQRIMIARALAHRPKLLVLDEATTALDPDTEAGICETLEELRGDIAILAVSHQPALVNAADRVYRLQGGRAHPVDSAEKNAGLPEGEILGPEAGGRTSAAV